MKTKPGLILYFLILLLLTSCAFKSVTRSKNIVYLHADSSSERKAQEFNVFAPRRQKMPLPVFIFIYGGSWNSGKKSVYSFLGNRMARRGVLTVIPDYPKSPQFNYEAMAMAAATAVQWVKDSISAYGGDASRLFVGGHSAGGHLASLITSNKKYFASLGMDNPVKGTVLIDAAGLDMYRFLKQENYPDNNTYIQTFTNNPDNWKDGSPLYHLHTGMPPLLVYVGAKTYPSIRAGNDMLVENLKKLNVEVTYQIVAGKRHKAMITQFLNPWNKRYKEMIDFMQTKTLTPGSLHD